MALDEELYSLEKPRHERGQGAWIRPGKRKLAERGDSGKIDGRVKSDPAKRKVKRAASERLSGGSQNLWSDIMSGANAPKLAVASEWGADAPVRSRSRKLIPMPEEGPESPYVNVETSIIEPEPPRGMFHGIGFYIYGFPVDRVGSLTTASKASQANPEGNRKPCFVAL